MLFWVVYDISSDISDKDVIVSLNMISRVENGSINISRILYDNKSITY